jgi:autotransporter-associated beta strand protein
MIKAGTGTLTLRGTNTYAGSTQVNAGRLVISGSLSGTTAVAISGGTLQLGAAERINNAAAFTLNGGSLETAGFSETVGSLSLMGDSTIDLGAGNSVLSFADSSGSLWTAGTLLTIANWSGLSGGGGMDQLYFGNSASGLGSHLSAIHFLNPDGFAPGTYGAQILPTGEVVAIPEPTALLSIIAGISLLLAPRRRRPAIC